MDKKYSHNILWLDDEPRVIEMTGHILKGIFVEKYQYAPNLIGTNSPKEFFQEYEEHKQEIDYIFLDINLGIDTDNGIEVYEKIRKVDKEVIIVFISAYLWSGNWYEYIEKAKKGDTNLFTLPIPFPLKIEKEEFDKYISKPIEEIINKNAKSIKKSIKKIELDSYKKIFYRDLKNLKELSKGERKKFVRKAHIFNRPYIEKYHEKNRHIKSIIIADKPNNIIYASPEELKPSFLIPFFAIHNKPFFAYNLILRDKLDIEEVSKDYFIAPKSVEKIPAQILEIADGHVLLNCLLDEEERQFQLRKYDLEPIEGAVTLEKNNIIQITITTFEGERVFSFKDGTPDLKQKFERKTYFDGKEDYSAFLKPKSEK